MPLPRKFSKRGSYYAYPFKRLPAKKTERRITMPQPLVRPIRFQIRSIIKDEYVQQSPWWFIIHRRGVPGRPEVGDDPLEARAVPTDLVRGTLPERIIYKSLVQDFHFVPDFDFLFQSSLQGGRLDTGGIVADFLLPYHRIVINPMGPTHYEPLRMYKDNEQTLALAELGYTVNYIDEHDVYDEDKFNNWMRTVIGGLQINQAQSHQLQVDQFNLSRMGKLLEEFSDLIRG